jgi:hypothetical protein
LPSKLTMERLKLLDDLGFVWNAPRGAKRKRSINEDNVIQDRKNESAKAENQERGSSEETQSIESGLNGHSKSEFKVTSHVEENLQSHDSQHSLKSPDLNDINQGMS